MTRSEPVASRPGTLGMGLTLLGGAAVLVSILVLTWYPASGGIDSVGRITFGRLAAATDLPAQRGVAGYPAIVPAYFDWLAWVLLIAVVAVGIGANLPSTAAGVLRVLGVVLGLAGAGATYWALQEYTTYGDEGTYALHQAGIGVWTVLAGFLVAGIGAAIGPRPV